MKIEISKIKVGKRIREDMGDIAGLAASIAENELLCPILLREDGSDTYKILAGCRRLDAAKLSGQKTIESIIKKENADTQSKAPRGVPYDAIIEIEENDARKDFTQSEKAKIAEIMRPHFKNHTNQGKRSDLEQLISDESSAKTRTESVDDKIGKILNESGETVRKRTKVFENIDEDTKKALDSGKKSLHSAYQKTVARENAEKPTPKLPAGKFNHIVEDPPWDYKNKNIGGAGKSGASFHYKTEPTNIIAKIPVHLIAADNAVLYMWTTNQYLITGSMLASEYYNILNQQRLHQSCKKITNKDKIKKIQEQVEADNELLSDVLKKQRVQSDAISVMHCHGFVPKCIVTWHKEEKKGWGGYWLNNTTEHLLIGIRGNVPAFGLPDETIIKSRYVPKSHSKKPEEAWHLIERCVNATRWNHKKLEMNCRTPRDGWLPHGDQISTQDIKKWRTK